ncbi:MAG TPA: hypothetical protein VFP91_04275 [Vicinamibacterales bacterium]|nr:hypothetical protein [Vicinamibacterales bacterium]
MTLPIKGLLVLPLVAALYFVHPALGFFGLASGLVAVLYTRRTHVEIASSMAHEDGITNAFLS